MPKRSFRRMGALLLSLLVLLSLLALPSCAVSYPAGSRIHDTRAAEIDAALASALTSKADALVAEADGYEASGEILKDAEGKDIDMPSYIAKLRDTAESLRGITYISYELAILEDLYEQYYIGVYRSVTDLLPTIVDILAEYGNFENITDTVSGTEALLQCYTLATEDPFDGYVDRESAREEAESPTTYVGIGVSVVQRTDGTLDIIAVTEGSPAAKAGIRSGDILTHVEGTDVTTIEYNEILSRVRGEAGTSVTLTFLRDGEPYTVTVTRAVVPNLTVSYKMPETGNGKTGYVRISQFTEGTFPEFVEAITALEAAGAENFVFDVRNNPGGQLTAVLAVLEYILPETEHPLIRLEYKDHTEEFYSVEEYLDAHLADDEMRDRYAPAKDHEISGRIAVLCDKYTTSAGELFTACLMDFERAEVYGETTYGKGVGQSGIQITDYYAYYAIGRFPEDSSAIYVQPSYLLIPTFYYSPPVSENYHGVGVVPHHTVSLSEEASEYYISVIPEAIDDPLQAAIAFVEGDASVSPPTAGEGGAGSGTDGTDQPPVKGDPMTPDTDVPSRNPATAIMIIVLISVAAVALISLAIYFFVSRSSVPKSGSDTQNEDDNNEK